VLLGAGYLLDFISDRQLHNAKATERLLRVGENAYSALIIPECNVIPTETLRRIVALADAGVTVVFAGERPTSAAGLDGIRTADDFGTINQALEALLKSDAKSVSQTTPVGNVADALVRAGVSPEPFAQPRRLQFIRRKFKDGVAYFVVNSSKDPHDAWTALRAAASSVVLLDPLTGDAGVAEVRPAGGGTEVRLQLAPGQSVVVRTYDHAVTDAAFTYVQRANDATEPAPATELVGPWNVTFVEGGPTMPAAVDMPSLKSWTELAGDDVKTFSGTARYGIEFEAPATKADAWELDLGEVHESADVRLNGEPLATLFGKPFRVRIPAANLRDHNELEIDVANLMANRIADLDRRGVAWKRFYNVNFAPRRGENRGPGGVFTAAAWKPLPSGLTGPVTLTPLRLRDKIYDEPAAK
jgi:hypothetical protein